MRRDRNALASAPNEPAWKPSGHAAMMGDLEFTPLLIVVATAFAAPLFLGLVPALRLQPSCSRSSPASSSARPCSVGSRSATRSASWRRSDSRSCSSGRLEDTTAQIRVRGAFLLLVGLVAAAETLGLEVILGAFLAGAILTLVDRDRELTHPQFRRKLEAAGYGIFIPVSSWRAASASTSTR